MTDWRRYKSTAKPWKEIPGCCGFFVGMKPHHHTCGKTATHRLIMAADNPEDRRYGWLCDSHSYNYGNRSVLVETDHAKIEAGAMCSVWKCTRRAARWDDNGYIVCNQCYGN